jgi:hypothetical protein
MDLRNVETMTSRTVTGGMGDGVDSFTADINIPFQPDMIILQAMTETNANPVDASAEVGVIRSDLVQNQTLTTFAPIAREVRYNINAPFINQRPINGTYTFDIRELSGTTLVHDNFITISLTFLFIKYK